MSYSLLHLESPPSSPGLETSLWSVLTYCSAVHYTWFAHVFYICMTIAVSGHERHCSCISDPSLLSAVFYTCTCIGHLTMSPGTLVPAWQFTFRYFVFSRVRHSSQLPFFFEYDIIFLTKDKACACSLDYTTVVM